MPDVESIAPPTETANPFMDLPQATPTLTDNPFASLPKVGDVTLKGNPFADLPESEKKTSAAGTFGREAAMGILPSAGAAGGFVVGAEMGAALGPVGALAGGLIGAVAGGKLTAGAQEQALEAFAPQTAEAIREMRAAGQSEHPVAAAAGGFAAALPVFEFAPGQAFRGVLAAGKAVAGKAITEAEKGAITATAAQAGLMGATGAVSPLLEGQTPTVAGVLESAATGAVLGKPRLKIFHPTTAVATEAEQNNAPLTAQTLKAEEPNAIPVKGADAQVLQPSQPKVELPKVGDGDAQSQVAAATQETKNAPGSAAALTPTTEAIPKTTESVESPPQPAEAVEAKALTKAESNSAFDDAAITYGQMQEWPGFDWNLLHDTSLNAKTGQGSGMGAVVQRNKMLAKLRRKVMDELGSESHVSKRGELLEALREKVKKIADESMSEEDRANAAERAAIDQPLTGTESTDFLPPEKGSGELFSSKETPFNLAGESATVESTKSTTQHGRETLVQNDLFAIQKVVENVDPTKSADAAQAMYGDARQAAAKIRNQLAVVDGDPVTRKAFAKEQRGRLKEVLALLEQRASKLPSRIGKGGPGAAAAGESGTYDPAAQLADALRTVKETDPLKRAQETSRIAEVWQAGKDTMTRAWGKATAAKESIKSNLLTLPEATPIKKLVAALDFQIQKSSAMSRDFGKALETTHPNKIRRNGIAILIDAGMDVERVKAAIAELPENTPLRVRRSFEAAAKLTDAERTTAEQIKTYFDQRLQDAQEAGVLKGFLEDYYTHVWKQPERMPAELKNAMSNGRVVSYFENARNRKLEDFITGIKLGKEPVFDPSLVLPRYNFNLDRAIASRAFIKKLTDTKEADGRPTAAPTGIGKQISKTEFAVKSDETGRTRRVFETKEEAQAQAREGESVVERENTASLISPKAKPEGIADYKPVDNPALKKWKWVDSAPDGTPILVEGDLVIHPDALQRVKNIMERERLTPGNAMRFLIRAGAEVKGAKLGVLSPFHQIHVGSHAVWHLVNPFSLKPEIDWTHPATKFAVEKGGLKLAADFHDKMAFSEGIGPGLIVQKLVPYSRMYSEYLFESFIPRLKLKTFEAVYQRDLKRYAGKLSPDQIAARAGDAVNNAYGELNRLWLGKEGRDPRLQRAMQVSLLAPDFLEARARFVAKAFTKYGAEERMALFVMGAGLYVTARVLNQLADGDPHWKEPHMAFAVRIGDKNYGIRSVIGDANHLLTDWRSFISTRINPLTTRTAIETVTQRDIRTGLHRSTTDQIADMLRQVVPSQLDSMLPGDRQWWFGLMQSMGVTARRQPTPEEIRKREEKAKKDAENPPAFELIYNPAHKKKK